jgi:hypothetical protein
MQTPGEDYEGTYAEFLGSFTFDFYSAPAATDRIEVYGVHYGHTFGGLTTGGGEEGGGFTGGGKGRYTGGGKQQAPQI